MDLMTWLAFAGVSTILVAIPGPTVMLVLGAGLRHGRSGALAAAPGVALGDLAAMSASMAGVGALLAASATLFTAVKLAGALWLAWLGLRMLRDAARQGALAPANTQTFAKSDRARIFRQASTVTLLNPKILMFFVAFAPQFLTPDAPFVPQAAIMTATFAALGFRNVVIWGLAAGGVRASLSRPGPRAWAARAGDACLLGAGALTALTARA
jgi:threonine/homoserine/homoserine lactone efflux protein